MGDAKTATLSNSDERGIPVSERQVPVWNVRTSEWAPNGPDGLYIDLTEGDGDESTGIVLTDQLLADLGYQRVDD